MDNTRKFMLKVTLGCLAIVTGITVWIISINDTYSVDSSGYIVTLRAEDGIIKKNSLDYGSELTLEGLPQFGFADYTAEKAGYSFNGWGTAKGCKTGKTDGTDDLTKDQTYYACFTQNSTANYTVTFDANGGNFEDGSKEKTVEYEERYYFTNLKVSKTDDNCANGYILDGWSNGEGKILNSYVDSAEDGKTLTAEWGSCKTNTADPEPTPTPEPNPGDDKGTTYNVVLRAPKGTIKEGSKDLNREIHSFQTDKFSYGDYTADKTGFTFTGWGDSENCTKGLMTGDADLTKKTEYYACFTASISGEKENYYVEFNLNGGDELSRRNSSSGKYEKTDEYKIDTKIVDYSEFKAWRNLHTFIGWSQDVECTNPKKTGTDDLNGDIILYACYTLNENTAMSNENTAMRNWVHLIANGSTINVGDIDDEEYQDQTWEDPKVANYDFTDGDFSFTVARNGRFRASKFTATPKDTTQYFKGWSKNDASCNEVIRYNNVSVTASTIYYACFGKAFNVTFDLNGGDALYNLDGEKITENPLKLGELDYTYYYATKSNSTFWGWSSTKSCKNLIYDVITDDTKYEYLEEDKTLYACYLDAYTVTFDLNGGETLYKKDAKMDENTEKLGYIFYDEYISKKSGSTFSGWSLDKDDCSNAKKNGGKHIEEPTTLYACYDIDGVGGCDDGNIDENVGTGSLLYVIYILGISSLLYTVYYIYKLKKTNMN